MFYMLQKKLWDILREYSVTMVEAAQVQEYCAIPKIRG